MSLQRLTLDELLGLLREGDMVLVARFFRLGRSRDHMIHLVHSFHQRGPGLLDCQIRPDFAAGLGSGVQVSVHPVGQQGGRLRRAQQVVPEMGDSKPVLATLLNGNDKKTGPFAPVCRCPAVGPRPVMVTVKRNSRVAWSKVPANEPAAAVATAGISWAPAKAPDTAGSAGAAASLMEQAGAAKKPAASKRPAAS